MNLFEASLFHLNLVVMVLNFCMIAFSFCDRLLRLTLNSGPPCLLTLETSYIIVPVCSFL